MSESTSSVEAYLLNVQRVSRLRVIGYISSCLVVSVDFREGLHICCLAVFYLKDRCCGGKDKVNLNLKRANRLTWMGVWCGGWDSNPRIPAEQPPQGCTFDLAWQPPPKDSKPPTMILKLSMREGRCRDSNPGQRLHRPVCYLYTTAAATENKDQRTIKKHSARNRKIKPNLAVHGMKPCRRT